MPVNAHPMQLSEPQLAAIAARTIPRRVQMPNRLDPMDCTLVIAALRRALVEAQRSWCRCCAHTTSSVCEPVQRSIPIGLRNMVIFEAPGDYAMRLWHSSMVLASWLDAHSACFTHSTVLECGAGTGLCSLTICATATASHVIATDISESGLALCKSAADIQGLGLLQTQVLDICSDQPLPKADWLIASDVMYTPRLADALASRVIEITRRGGRAIVADPGRPTRLLFQAALERQGFGGGSSFRPWACVSPHDRPLTLLHIDGERPVSHFPAHAELEG